MTKENKKLDSRLRGNDRSRGDEREEENDVVRQSLTTSDQTFLPVSSHKEEVKLLEKNGNNHVKKIDKRSLEHFLAGTNSYLGVFKHCNTYKMRRKMLTISLSKLTQKYFYFSAGYDKINIRL